MNSILGAWPIVPKENRLPDNCPRGNCPRGQLGGGGGGGGGSPRKIAPSPFLPRKIAVQINSLVSI